MSIAVASTAMLMCFCSDRVGFHDTVGPWEHQGLVAIGVAHQVGRCAVVTAHLEDLAQLVGVPHVLTVNM